MTQVGIDAVRQPVVQALFEIIQVFIKHLQIPARLFMAQVLITDFVLHFSQRFIIARQQLPVHEIRIHMGHLLLGKRAEHFDIIHALRPQAAGFKATQDGEFTILWQRQTTVHVSSLVQLAAAARYFLTLARQAISLLLEFSHGLLNNRLMNKPTIHR